MKVGTLFLRSDCTVKRLFRSDFMYNIGYYFWQLESRFFVLFSLDIAWN